MGLSQRCVQVKVALVTRNTTQSVDAFFDLVGQEWRQLFGEIRTREFRYVKPDKRLLLELAEVGVRGYGGARGLMGWVGGWVGSTCACTWSPAQPAHSNMAAPATWQLQQHGTPLQQLLSKESRQAVLCCAGT
jgi:hypothetical protein